jgi:hypothetical protein
MISGKPCVLALLLVALLLLAACGGGGDGIEDGIRDSCQHLNCTPETNAMEKLTDTLEDAEDGIIDEGESELGDAVIRAAEWLSGTGE